MDGFRRWLSPKMVVVFMKKTMDFIHVGTIKNRLFSIC